MARKKKEEPKDPRLGNSIAAAAELRQFIERYETLEADKKAVADEQKELMAEAKGRGYDTKVLRKLIAERKRDADELAEEEAILQLYRDALQMYVNPLGRREEPDPPEDGDDDDMV